MSIAHGSVSAPAKSGAASVSKRLEELKLRVHRQLLERLDLVALSSLDSTQAEEHIRTTLQRLLQADSPDLSGLERDPYRIDNLLAFGALTPQMVRYLAAAIQGRLNMIISGGTGAGKTTLLNCLTSFISHQERVVTIEDSAELQLQQPHVVPLETRTPDLDGKGEITQRDLVRNALRMRPDRIIVGEARGAEALDMLQAMNTGHDGSLTTVHANSPRECLQRLEVMVLMAGYDLPVKAIRQQVGAAVNVLVQAARLTDGSRKIVRVSEIVGMESDQLQLQDIFEFVQTGVTPEGRVQGQFRASGLRSRYFDRLVAAGVKPEDILPGAGER